MRLVKNGPVGVSQGGGIVVKGVLTLVTKDFRYLLKVSLTDLLIVPDHHGSSGTTEDRG